MCGAAAEDFQRHFKLHLDTRDNNDNDDHKMMVDDNINEEDVQDLLHDLLVEMV